MEAAVSQIHPELAELRPGQRFEGRYACISKERSTSRNGSSYLSLRLRDRSGTVAARAFRDADRIALRFEAGDAVAIRGRAERFRGELVVEVEDARKLEPGTYDETEFLPAAYRSVDELEGFLEHLSDEVHAADLRAVVDRVVFAGPLAADFRRAPATRRAHHAYLGGLLEHTVAVATLVLETCTLHPRLDSDLLMAAAIVHDVGRAREFTYGAEFGHQRGGPAARSPDDRRRDRRPGCGRARPRSPAGVAQLRPLPPRARRRAGPGPGRAPGEPVAGLRLARGAGALPAQRA